MSLSPTSAPPAAPCGPARRGLFRAHQAEDLVALLDQHATGGLFVQLSREWTRLGALPSMAATLRRWGLAEPALLEAASLGDVLDRIDSSAGQQEDAMLLALVRLAQAGQQLAGRVLLQAMLPKIARLSHQAADVDLEDRRQAAVATFWEVLAHYPAGRRISRVAANLALDTLHELTRDYRRPMIDVPVDDAYLDYLQLQDPVGIQPGPEMFLTPEADLLEVIAWGMDVGAISSQDAALLARVYLPHPDSSTSGASVTRASAELGLSPASVRQRCSRARRRLIAAVQADAQPTPPVTSGDGSHSPTTVRAR